MLLFGISLFAPAVEVQVMRKLLQFNGWQATRISLQLLTESARQPLQLLLSAAAIGNLSFPLGVLVLHRARRRRPLLGLLMLNAGSLVLGLVSPMLIGPPSPHLLYGYYVWITAFCVLAFATVVALWRQPVAG